MKSINHPKAGKFFTNKHEQYESLALQEGFFKLSLMDDEGDPLRGSCFVIRNYLTKQCRFFNSNIVCVFDFDNLLSFVLSFVNIVSILLLIGFTGKP